MPHSSFDGVIVTIHRDFHASLLKLRDESPIISLNFALKNFSPSRMSFGGSVAKRFSPDSVFNKTVESWQTNHNSPRCSSYQAYHSIVGSEKLSREGKKREILRGSERKILARASCEGERRWKPTKITVIPFFSFFHLIRHQEGNFIILIRTFFLHSQNPRSSSTSFRRNSFATKTINAN